MSNVISKKTPSQIFQEHSGQLSMSSALKLGISRYALYNMRDKGLIEPVARGLYRLKEIQALSNPDLTTVCSLYPNAVICLISALCFYQMTTQIPHSVYIAVRRNASVPTQDYPPIKVCRLSDKFYNLGIDEHLIDGIKIKIYNLEKTLVDCFRFRNQIGLDIVIEALKIYKETRRMDLNKISYYAKMCKMEKVMQPYLEVLV